MILCQLRNSVYERDHKEIDWYQGEWLTEESACFQMVWPVR